MLKVVQSKIERIYAVGDIHGRLDCLRSIHGQIRRDLAEAGGGHCLVVYLGDYIDRGPDSKGVIDELLLAGEEFDQVFLLGNHEHAMALFLRDKLPYSTWMMWGGGATVSSYGLNPCLESSSHQEIAHLRRLLLESMPPEHNAFFDSLIPFHVEGDYLFVHAGLRPGVDLEDQQLEDFLMIRQEFFSEAVTIEKTVVHGHTIFESPYVRERSIGIDTGAYRSDILTALVIEGSERRFITS